ncbi:hypothetical protein ACL598_21590 [Bordetella bronchialis]|uniref:DUF342 domain-containing protein n=1 Tax=Bordetella bronchialis TaxID=463025 RepID=A0A193G341_9BORD|nr:hypothetical protein [Bordetella bronchialis]ANN73634.1 hypothetical protein BAU08_21795 [Bordetella bronchialis]
MDITKAFIKAKQPCADGFRWYLRNATANESYQQLLDALVADGRVGDACWLLDQFGPTDAVRVVSELEVPAMVFAGTLHVRGTARVETVLRTGRDLRVDGGLRAGRVAAGRDIRCGAALACDAAVSAGGDLLVAWNLDAGNSVSAERLRVGWDLAGCAGLRARADVTVGGALWLEGVLEGLGGVRVGEALECGAGIRVRHGVACGATLRCGGHVDAGWGIRAAGSIVVQGAIRAGESIRAGGEIRAGAGYGIYAGLDVRDDAWETSAQVRARHRPAQLHSGWWAGPDERVAGRDAGDDAIALPDDP